MGSVERFEDLVAWQRARVLTTAIYRATRQSDFARDLGVAGQLQRAAVSVMSNIAEGFERGSAKEFHHFLSIAKASLAELRSQLYIAADIGYLDRDQFEQLSAQAADLARSIGALRISVGKHANGHRAH